MYTHKVTIQLTHQIWRKWQESYCHNKKRRILTPTIILVTKIGIRTESKVMKPNQKIRIITTQVLQVRTLEKRHGLKIILVLLGTD